MVIFLKRKIKIIVCIAIIFLIILNYNNIYNFIQSKLYPKLYQAEVSRYTKEYNVDEDLVFAIIKAESNFNKDAISNKNARGLMQLMYETASDVAKIINIEISEEKLMEPDTNINLGTKYISILINKYKNIEVALCAYNAGSGNVDNWIAQGIIKSDGSDIENVPFMETNNYVRKILRDYKIYKNL